MPAEGGGAKLRVLIVRGSFGTLGGAERELLQLIRNAHQRWTIGLATLELPEESMHLIHDVNLTMHTPDQPVNFPTGALHEIRASASKRAQSIWRTVDIPWDMYDVVHLSVCRGTLELLPCIPNHLPIHYHCLEPPRWLYEDVLHRHLDGRPKRPLWITRRLFSAQRRCDQRFVKQLLRRKNSSISGNSPWIQSWVATLYGLASDPSKTNGEPPQRNEMGQPIEATHVMHVIDETLWPEQPTTPEQEAFNQLGLQHEPYVITVGKISYVKGTLETLESLEGTGLHLVHVGGGNEDDKVILHQKSKEINVPIHFMPRISQEAFVGLIRHAVAMVSHAHNEPFGLTPLEAMAVGTPAIMVDEGGFHDTMSPVQSGRLITRDDSSAWKQAYKDAQNPELRRAWAQQGREYVLTHFNQETQLRALERMFQIT